MHTLRILIIDDHGDTAESLALLLRRRGHEVLVARNGERGLEMALAHAPDAVLLDLGLPDLDGSEVARRLRAGPGGAELLLLALTGRAADEESSGESARFD